MSWIITGTQKNNWTPADIDTALWLDAADASTITESGGVVGEWRDKSGNSRHAVQSLIGSRPAYIESALNGLSAIGFEGGNDNFMTVNHESDLNVQIASSTIAVVYKKSAGFRVLQKGQGVGRAGDAFFLEDATSLSVAGAFVLNYSANQNIWQIDVGTWDNETIKQWRNGLKLIPQSPTDGSIVNSELDPANTPLANTEPLYIGKRDNPTGTSGAMTGQIASILICKTALSTMDRQKLEGYLAHKWGLTANLPADHPYKTAVPVP